MSIPIPPGPPPVTPPPNPFFGTGPSILQPVDNTSPSLASSLSTPPLDAGSPQLSIAQFYGAISNANIGQKLQEFIDQMRDPEFRKRLMEFALEQSAYMAEVITLVYRYDDLATQLKNLDLNGLANHINQKLAALNAGSGIAADNAAIATFNNAINAYNNARTTYENALLSYQTALNSFETAQDTYNTALNTWNTALAAYQNGSITQAELESARSTFNAAENQFENVDKPAFDNAQSTFDTAKSAFDNAVTTFNSARDTYNTYVASRSSAYGDLSGAIDNWNAVVGNVAGLLARMNAIRNELGLSPITSTGNLAQFTGLSNYGFPAGPNATRDAVQTDVDQDNAFATLLNSIISSIDGKVTAINAGGYNPPLTTPSSQSLIPNLPTTNSGTAASTIPSISIPTSISIEVPDPQDLITDYLLPRLSILEALKTNNEKENLYRADVTDERFKNAMSGQHVIAGSLGSSNLGASNAVGIAASPFLGAILSKHAFETFFNVYGVPQGSSLVDQIGALYHRLATNAGLLSAGPAQKILNNGNLTGANGKQAVQAAVALGYLSLVNTIADSAELKSIVKALIEKDVTLSRLTKEQKAALLDAIVGELGAALKRGGLNDLSKVLDLPGLVPQILARLGEDDSSDIFNGQLLHDTIFASELARELQMSSGQIDDIIKQAINQSRTTEAAFNEFVIKELEQQGQVGADVARQVQQASTLATERVKAEEVKTETVKKQAFKDGLLKGLAALEFDPVKADLLAEQIPVGTINETITRLTDKGFTLPEANQVATTAVNAANAKDPISNPLSSFLVKQLGTTTEMAGLLKGQIVNILSPAVGMRQSLQVAEDYGSLVFTHANSITNTLQVNERHLDAFSYFVYDSRLYENYREATKSYRSPELADDSPLKLGITLLLTGIPGGIANQGVTSADNTLGPSANQSKHATSYPGIFG